MIPFSEKEANLVISYPDYLDNIKLDINDMWGKFYSLVCKKLDQNFRITDNFEITRYMMGICNKPKIDNTYFVVIVLVLCLPGWDSDSMHQF